MYACFTLIKFSALVNALLFSLVIQANSGDKEWWQYYDRTKVINLQFSDGIKKGYEVSVAWAPDGGLAPMLTGPALINFRSNEWGGSFSIKADYFHLPKDMLEESGLRLFNDNHSINLSLDLSKVYKVRSDSRHLQRISLWSNDHTSKAMLLGKSHTPFFFEDVDLDNVDELVITSFRSGQRSGHEYLIYELIDRYGVLTPQLKTRKPFDQIDMLSSFNLDNKTILIHSSGGFCESSENVYKMANNIFQHAQHTSWNSVPSEQYGRTCIESTYDIVDGQKVLKSRSESY